MKGDANEDRPAASCVENPATMIAAMASATKKKNRSSRTERLFADARVAIIASPLDVEPIV